MSFTKTYFVLNIIEKAQMVGNILRLNFRKFIPPYKTKERKMKVKDYLERVIKQEGNEKEFVYQGYECMILRVEGLGHLCGYVRIPYNSPLKDLGYDVDFDVHGGITYNGTFKHKGKEGHWIGFDTAHCMDLSLYQLEKGYATDNLFYRDMNYVTLEIQKLVHQIKNWR